MKKSMKKSQLGVSLFFLLLALPAMAGEVFVIAHEGMSLKPQDVVEIYNGNMQSAGSVKLAPIDNKSIMSDFLSKALSTDPVKYSAAWAKKAFRDGLVGPKLKANDAEVLDFVKATPGAVGYVGSQPTGVTVVTKY